MIQIGLVWLETDHYIPADLLRQVQHRGLSVQSIEQENIEERAAIEIRKSAEQPQSRGLLSFIRLEPFEGEERLDRAADDRQPRAR